MAIVRIESVSEPRKNDRDLESVRVYVDGALIGEGWIGGEPEDNCRSRDYRWVEPLLRELANRLGAEAEIVSVVEPPDPV